MNPKDEFLLKILPNNQFITPYYQRQYTWEAKHCKQLFDDIVAIGKNKDRKSHFTGSIIIIEKPRQPGDDISKYYIIDGQQRIVSVILLLKAIHNILDTKSAKNCTKSKVEERLFNSNVKGDDKYKILLSDNKPLRDILDHNSLKSDRLSKNFKFFTSQLEKEDLDIDVLWDGINKLKLITITVEKDEDPQAIFMSINSTGKVLSQTDLIKSYIMIQYDDDTQKELYEKYWYSMEKPLTENKVNHFEDFIRFYLIIHHSNTNINQNAIYEEFKKYIEEKELDRKEELKNIYEYSKYYRIILGFKDVDNSTLDIAVKEFEEINNALKYMRDQKTSIPNFIFLKVLADLHQKIINVETTKKIIRLIDSYMFRQFICDGVAGLNKELPKIVPKITNKKYFESLEEQLLSLDGMHKFQSDTRFKESLRNIPIYEKQNICKYALMRLENYNNEEQVNMNTIEIEHIMPQTLTEPWKKYLGIDHKEIHDKYLHTIGNLTLTGKNPALSNKQFDIKLDTYKDSSFKLSRDLVQYTKWDQNSIKRRANDLIDLALNVWPRPIRTVDKTFDDTYASIEEKHLEKTEVKLLWNTIKSRIKTKYYNYDIEFEMRKVYGKFIIFVNGQRHAICSMTARKNYIIVGYNVKKNDNILETENLEDVSNVGTNSIGDYKQNIKSDYEIDEILRHLDKIVDFIENTMRN